MTCGGYFIAFPENGVVLLVNSAYAAELAGYPIRTAAASSGGRRVPVVYGGE